LLVWPEKKIIEEAGVDSSSSSNVDEHVSPSVIEDENLNRKKTLELPSKLNLPFVIPPSIAALSDQLIIDEGTYSL